MSRRWLPAFLLALLTAVLASGQTASPAAAAPEADETRYSLAGGCYALRSRALGRLVAKSAGGGYRASSARVSEAEPFRMQATDLGKYLLYGRQGDFLAHNSQGLAETAARASESADWRVDSAESGAFRIVSPEAGKVLAVSGGGELGLAEASRVGQAALFGFERADGCAVFPEAETRASGRPRAGTTSHEEVAGFLDAHTHTMFFEAVGGSLHCGRPWHPYGVTHAMVDCPDHEPNGAGAVVENVQSYGSPLRTHDTRGWPTFRDWPHHASLTHEQVYYKGLERAWMGGLRVFVSLLTDQGLACEVFPNRRYPCDEMASVHRQLRRNRELQDYIDAQHGGPGKGWFRLVRDPFEARRVINQGKLAVVMGIETSRPFNCRVFNEAPLCDRASIDRQLDELYDLGVRDMELINKLDNALGGVAGDAGTNGVVSNLGNRYETGSFFRLETCQGEGHDHTPAAPSRCRPTTSSPTCSRPSCRRAPCRLIHPARIATLAVSLSSASTSCRA